MELGVGYDWHMGKVPNFELKWWCNRSHVFHLTNNIFAMALHIHTSISMRDLLLDGKCHGARIRWYPSGKRVVTMDNFRLNFSSENITKGSRNPLAEQRSQLETSISHKYSNYSDIGKNPFLTGLHWRHRPMYSNTMGIKWNLDSHQIKGALWKRVLQC